MKNKLKPLNEISYSDYYRRVYGYDNDKNSRDSKISEVLIRKYSKQIETIKIRFEDDIDRIFNSAKRSISHAENQMQIDMIIKTFVKNSNVIAEKMFRSVKYINSLDRETVNKLIEMEKYFDNIDAESFVDSIINEKLKILEADDFERIDSPVGDETPPTTPKYALKKITPLDYRDIYSSKPSPWRTVEFKEQLMTARLSSLCEEELIFGDTLKNLQDILELAEAADPINVIQDAASSRNNVLKSTAANIVDKNNARNTYNTIEREAMSKIRKEKIKDGDPLVNNALTEDEIKNKISSLELSLKILTEKQNAEFLKEESHAEIAIKKNIEYKQNALLKLQDKRNKINAQYDSRRENIQKQIDSLKDNLQRITGTSETTSTESLTESEEKNTIEYGEFTQMLFNGLSGNILKYFIQGQINNLNVSEVQIAKEMKNNPEVQEVLKKINFYLRKTRTGLKYEEYIDLKVQKSKFRSLFIKAKEKYLNRFKK